MCAAFPAGGVQGKGSVHMYDSNSTRSLAVLACVIVLTTMLTVDALAQNAKITRITGGVTHRVGATGSFIASRAGTQLPAGSRVRTDATGRAEVALPNGTVFRISERTDLVLESPSKAQVSRGQIYARVIAGTAVQIGGATATAAVRGTTLELEVGDDETTTLTVGRGEVAFFNALGSATVLAGQQSTARPGEAPSRPIAIDPSSLMAWEATVENLMLEFESPPQIGTDPQVLEQALPARQAAVEAHPTDAAAQAALARALLDLGRVDEALAAAEAGAEAAPDTAEYEGLLAWALLEVGRPEDAEGHFAAAAQAEPENSRWRTGRALVALAAGRTDEAIQLLHDAAQAAPDDALVQAYVAAALLRQGDLEAAADAAEAAVRLGPELYLGFVYLAHVRLLQSDLSEAVAAAARASELAPASSMAHAALGKAQFFGGDLEAARPELERAVELDPLSAAARLSYAKLLAADGELEDALAQARAAVSMDPESAPARSTLGLLLLLNHDPWAADEQFAQATELDPHLSEAHTGWAQALQRQGRFREAMAQQQAALSLDTDSASVRNNLGGIYASRGEFDTATEHLQSAIDLQPGWGLPHANLALVHLEQAQYAQALEMAERAVDLGERSPFVYTVLARTYARQGRIDQALAALRQAVALDPQYPQAHYQLSRLYLEQDRARDAVRAILSALTQDPSAMLESRLYARSEATAFAGSHETVHADAYSSGQASEGRLSYFASGMWEDSDGWRTNQDSTEAFAEVLAGYQSSPASQLAFYGTWFDHQSGLPGPAAAGWAGDPDDELDFSGWDAMVAWRHRISHEATATLKLTARESSLRFDNPDALSPTDADPFRRLENEQSLLIPEIRLDAKADDLTRVMLGYAYQITDVDQSGIVGTRVPGADESAFETFAASSSPDVQTGWVECERLLSDRLSLLGGLHWGKVKGGPSTCSPRIVALYRPDRASSLAFTLDPIFRSDIAELAPVEPLADPFGLRYLNFTEGGIARSWALRYQRLTGSHGALTATVAYQDVEGLLIDGQDPSLTGLPLRVLMSDGHRLVADAAYEQWLADGITGRVWVRWQDTAGDFPEQARTDVGWPYAPEWQAGGRVDYIGRSGWRVGLEGIWVDDRRHDPGGAAVVSDYFVTNLTAQYQRNLHENYFVRIANLTDTDYQTWLGFPQPGLSIYAGMEYRH